jgi:hypothetical protein
VITDFLINTFTSLIHATFGALPAIPVPSWMTTSGPIGTVFADAGSMGAWFPLPLVITVALAISGTWAVSFGIKAFRIVLSFLTLGGGSAA